MTAEAAAHLDLDTFPRRFQQLAVELTTAEPGALDELISTRGRELTGAAAVEIWHRDGGRFARHGEALSEGDLNALYAGQPAKLLPLKVGDRIVGYLAFVWETAEPSDRARLEAFAALVALALCRAKESDLSRALSVRDELLSIASHELNTPLTALQLNLQALMRKVSKASASDTLEAGVVHQALAPAVSQVSRLAHMLSHLVDVARIQTGRMFLDLEAFDLCEVVREVVHRMGAMASARGTVLVLEQCESFIGYWDRLRVEQVLHNLLSNAIKYGEGKPVRVWLTRRGGTMELGVRDEGIGISEADLPRIFQRFERATLKRQADSFGLGLYISNQIAKAHGGAIEVESRPGTGSTFRLLLPTHRVFDTPEGQPT